MGVDVICAQGTEAGGHTGDVATMPLIPQCVDLCRGHVSPLHGTPVAVVGAGGIYDGRGMAAAMMLGAQAVWVGTRFVATEEASAGGYFDSIDDICTLNFVHKHIRRVRISKCRNCAFMVDI